MKKTVLLILIILLNLSVQVSAQVSDKESSGKIIVQVDLSDHGSNEPAQVWIPYPVSNAHQTITNIDIQGSMSSSGVYTDTVFSIPMLYAKWDKGIAKRTLTFSFEANRKEVLKKDLPKKETSWDRMDYQPYLASTSLGPIDGQIKKLADQITQGKTSVLEKARAIYDYTCRNTYRDPETKGCGKGDVCTFLKKPGGKCADISSLYVALARAAGVPTREIFGIRQGKADTQDISKWQHCWAEFYLPGYGWVPVDPADVRKMMLKENLALEDSKTKVWQEYFWGGVDEFRLKLGEGRDIVLNPRQTGAPVNYLMYPYAQIGARTLDWLEPEKFKYQITFYKTSK